MRIIILMLVLWNAYAIQAQSGAQIIDINNCNTPELFAKIKIRNTYAFLFFLNENSFFDEQKQIIDSLAKSNYNVADYLIIKYPDLDKKKVDFFGNKVRANHYQFYSPNPPLLFPYYQFGGLMTGSNSFIKLFENNCSADKYLAQLEDFFLPTHQKVIEKIFDNHLEVELSKLNQQIIAQNLLLSDDLEELKRQVNGKREVEKNTFNFYLQIGASFGLGKNYSILNDQGNSSISSERSSGLNLRFSISPSQPIFKLGEKNNLLNIGIQFSDNQQQLEGTIYQRDSETILPNEALFVDVKSGVIRESLRTRVLSVPILIKTELKGDETYALGSICGFQLNRLIGSSYQVVSGSYDARAYSADLNQVIENVSELGLINGNKISNQRGELSLKHTGVNPTVGFYIERRFDVNRSFHTELTFNPLFRLDVLNTEGGMIATSASSYNGLFNGVSRVSLPLVNLMIGFSI